jgi:hypothetical protein
MTILVPKQCLDPSLSEEKAQSCDIACSRQLY